MLQVFRHCINLTLLALVTRQSTASDEELQRWINEAVMPKAGCKLLLVGREVVPTAEHFPLFVSGVVGERLKGIIAQGGDEVVVAPEQILRMSDAAEYYTRRIAEIPRDAWSYEMRAVAIAYAADDDAAWQRVIDDFSKAVELGRRTAVNLGERAQAHFQRKEFAAALADVEAAIQLDAADADLKVFRANLLSDLGRLREAVDQFETLLQANPESAEAHNDFAILLATSSDEGIRDGKRAVALALEACELSDWQEYPMLDTLAAAYAEASDFETAVAMQQKALEMLEGVDDDEVGQMRERLKLYGSAKPYRRTPQQAK